MSIPKKRQHKMPTKKGYTQMKLLFVKCLAYPA